MKKKQLLYVLAGVGTLFLFSCGKGNKSSLNTEDSKQSTPSSQISDSSTLPIEQKGLFIKKDENLKVTQFADLHFGDPDRPYHNGKEEETKKYMQYVIENEKPNLIVCSGDNILDTGVKGLQKFVDLMESYKTSWTFVFGNHDGESAVNKSVLHNAILDATEQTQYLIYEDGFIDNENSKYGNFSIKVYNDEDKTLRGAIVLIDAGIYNYSQAKYQTISENQVSWYESEIEKLNKEYGKNSTIPTILFSHIQLPSFYNHYVNAKNNVSDYEFVVSQELTPTEIETIKEGGMTTDNRLYEKIVELGSTKGIFVGHEHNYYFQVKHQGIICGFGPQTGHSNTFAKDNEPRSTSTYILNSNFDITTNITKEPALILSDETLTSYVGDEIELSYKLLNIDGTVNVQKTSTEENATYELIGNDTIIIKPTKAGEFSLEFTAPYDIVKTFSLTINEPLKYDLYNDKGIKVKTFDSLYAAVDEIFCTGLSTGSYVTIENETDKVFTYDSNLPYNYVTKKGAYLGFDSNKNVTNGQSKWWADYKTELSIFQQDKASLLNTETTSPEFGFQNRPTSFSETNTDGSGGFQVGGGEPNSTWAGWQASIYKAGISTAQYAGWADNVENGKTKNRFVLNYDLSNSVMKPSQNANQPLIVDFWLGHSYARLINDEKVGINPIIMGISFDAGTVASTSALENGTTRPFKLFYEDINLNEGLTTVSKASRTYGDEVGSATWNKENGVWEFKSTIELQFLLKDSETENFTMTLTAKVNDSTKSLTKSYTEVINLKTFRLIYGVSCNPDLVANTRKISDITNGGYLKNVIQTSGYAYKDNEQLNTIAFLAGRISNKARQVGLHGCDVLSCKNDNGKAIFDFDYR